MASKPSARKLEPIKVVHQASEVDIALTTNDMAPQAMFSSQTGFVSDEDDDLEDFNILITEEQE